MKLITLSYICVAIALSATPAAAQNEPAPTETEAPAPDLSTQKPPEAPANNIKLEDWKRDDWMLVAPKNSLVELSGYFRVRGDLFRKLNFNNDAQWENSGRYTTATGGSGSFTGTNMRLRLEPTINPTDNIQIVTTIDVLDNIQLGSTPNTLPYSGSGTPTNVLATSQRTPRRGENSVIDSIAVKRVYARMTALNEQLELRVGRMPDMWGLGMMVNDGDCLDCDFGTVTDRIAVTFKLASHLFTPMFDWISTGPVSQPFGSYDPQPQDAFRWDDAVQYALRASKVDHPDDIAESVSRGETVANYGVHMALRMQSADLQSGYYNGSTASTGVLDTTAFTGSPKETRSATVYIGDAFLKLYHRGLEFRFETALQAGQFKDKMADTGGTALKQTNVMKYGAAMELLYRLQGNYSGVLMALKSGIASGDSQQGYGALDQADSQRNATQGDRSLNNFQFSPDYHVDMLMFRRVIGTVTDAWYLKPEVTYNFDENVAGRFAAIYSQAMERNSTASCFSTSGNAKCTTASGTGSKPMGLEFDGELSYGLAKTQNTGSFKTSLAGALLFPFGAFDNPSKSSDDRGASFAWALQAKMYWVF